MSFRQTTDDVELTIDLPKGVKGRDISVTMKYNLIKFGLKNGHSMAGMKDDAEGESGPTLLQRLLNGMVPYHNIDPDISTWTLVDGQLVITLVKRKAIEWKFLCHGFVCREEGGAREYSL